MKTATLTACPHCGAPAHCEGARSLHQAEGVPAYRCEKCSGTFDADGLALRLCPRPGCRKEMLLRPMGLECWACPRCGRTEPLS